MTGTNLFEQQKRNLRRTAAILTGFVAFLVFLGIGADYFLYGSGAGPGFPIATLGALLFGAGSSLWALKAGDKAVLDSANAVPIDPTEPRQRVLDNVVEEMAIAGGLPKPAVYLIPDSDPNAFATGSGPERSSVAVTAGLLDALDREVAALERGETPVARIRVHSWLDGRHVEVDTGDGSVVGIAAGIGDDGSLLLDAGVGRLALSVGEVARVHQAMPATVPK